jgi:hypothetical protein
VYVAPTVPAASPPVSTAPNAAHPSPQSSSSGSTTAGAAEASNPAAQPNAALSPTGQSSIGGEKSPNSGQPNPTGPGSSATPRAIPSQNAAGNPGGSSSPTPAGPTVKGSKMGGDLVLEVATTERTWVAVDADGKTIFQQTLNPNEVKTFTAKDSFEVWTGNAQGTVLTLNGATQKSLGREGEIKRIHLTRNSLQQPAP